MSYSFTAPIKDPSAVLDYVMDWSPWLATGETIIASPLPLVTSANPAMTVANISVSDGDKVRFRLSGGNAGSDYLVTVRITTSSGQVDERTIRIQVREL